MGPPESDLAIIPAVAVLLMTSLPLLIVTPIYLVREKILQKVYYNNNYIILRGFWQQISCQTTDIDDFSSFCVMWHTRTYVQTMCV